LARPPWGWIKAVREALGISMKQLGERTGMSQSRIARIEKVVINGTLTMNTLRHIAEAMNCQLVYALAPNQALDDMVLSRAEALADQRLAHTNQTMKLEDQALTKLDLQTERERLVAGLLHGDPRRLWDDR
jgi:predicted DNA-binding mobile mystery protein A